MGTHTRPTWVPVAWSFTRHSGLMVSIKLGSLEHLPPGSSGAWNTVRKRSCCSVTSAWGAPFPGPCVATAPSRPEGHLLRVVFPGDPVYNHNPDSTSHSSLTLPPSNRVSSASPRHGTRELCVAPTGCQLRALRGAAVAPWCCGQPLLRTRISFSVQEPPLAPLHSQWAPASAPHTWALPPLRHRGPSPPLLCTSGPRQPPRFPLPSPLPSQQSLWGRDPGWESEWGVKGVREIQI